MTFVWIGVGIVAGLLIGGRAVVWLFSRAVDALIEPWLPWIKK